MRILPIQQLQTCGVRPKPTGSPKNPKRKGLGNTQKNQGNIKLRRLEYQMTSTEARAMKNHETERAALDYVT
jgi:hypothetical protein